jgi:hypothetical protein
MSLKDRRWVLGSSLALLAFFLLLAAGSCRSTGTGLSAVTPAAPGDSAASPTAGGAAGSTGAVPAPEFPPGLE